MSKSSESSRQNLDWYLTQPIDVQLELALESLELSRIVINSILDGEVSSLAGERYQREKPNGGRYSRWGNNPGSVRIGSQRVRLEVPRVIDSEERKSHTLETYKELRALPVQDKKLIASILRGLSMRDYEGATERLFDSFGLSASSISRRFKEHSEQALKEFEERKFEQHTFVAMFIDGKRLAKSQMIVVLGITDKGQKIVLGVCQTDTENARSIGQMLENIKERGFRYDGGLLCIIDGSKGIFKAVQDAFGCEAIIQRCQWHKRENVVSYLAENHQDEFRRKLQKAYNEENYELARNKLREIHEELIVLNRSAANSLKEGIEETLTIQRLGLMPLFGRSFTTTNCIESFNSGIEKYAGKVTRWMDSNQKYRWTVMACLEMEERMHMVGNHKKLHLMANALKMEAHKATKEPLEPDNISTKN
jgi:transposase-like protein